MRETVRKTKNEKPSLPEGARCVICNEVIETWDHYEWVKARRGTELFMHTKCVEKSREKA